ncbi:hypothetical protein DFH09DRAFT_1397385 [Mycena vulgaris]|nr:hypothetical protein DFH09DRAFT_1397385 [Mycena vulgaris]
MAGLLNCDTDPDSYVPERLSPNEAFWRNHQVWLQEYGYMLRPRYRPDWVPSRYATGTERRWYESEDGKPSVHYPPGFDNFHILVMPLLRTFGDPRFETIGEGVDFFGQIFEGLQRLKYYDGRFKMCPEGFHPINYWRKRDFYSGDAKFYTRTQRPPKYYLTDFGLSRIYASKNPPPLEPVIFGGDRSVPEFKITDEYGPIECDPFPVDVYYLGNMIKTDFLDGRDLDNYGNKMSGFEFMRSLANDMTAEVPAKRPTMDKVLDRFTTIRAGLSSWKLRSRVVKAKDSPWSLDHIIKHWYLRIGYVLLRIPAIPTPSTKK